MMSSGGREQMLRNAPAASAIAELPKEDKADREKKQPAGTVERVLNFQERSLLVVACKLHCAKQDKGDHKAQSKLSKLITIVADEEVVEYFDMIDDSLEERVFKWQRARNDWLLIQQYLAGGITAEDAKKRSPALDVEVPMEKPRRRQPVATKDEIRGPERSFYLPSKVDSWVQDVLRATNWPNPEKAEYVTELCGKFGIKSDEE